MKNNKACLKVIAVYLAAVFGYALFVRLFTIPVHLKVDEELYISMAKSFHYAGNFSRNGEILNYSCVLYSMLLSLAYYFYKPESILFVMRMIGVLVMLSSIFPIYFLGKRILKKEKYAIGVAVFFCFLPSVMDVAYCMQEVLCYPLFLWLVFCIYREAESQKAAKFSKYTLEITILSVLCYFTKTYMIFIPVTYGLYVIAAAMKDKEKDVWKKLLVFGLLFISLSICGKLVINGINGGAAGVNHYSAQFSQLFPLTGKTFLAAMSCIIFYLAALLFYVGILPMILLFSNRKKYENADRGIICFLLLGAAILIVEIVITIVLTEEGSVFFPHKFLYRYFQVFEIPMIMLFIKGISSFEIPTWMWKVYVGVIGYMGMYSVWMGNRQNTSIIDAPVYLFIENITKKIVPGFSTFVCILSAGVVGAGYFLKKKKGTLHVLKCFRNLCVIVIGGFFIINLVQLPYYTNRAANGTLLQKEAVEIARYYNENRNQYDKVYYVSGEDEQYQSAIYAYFPTEVERISIQQYQENAEEKALYIMAAGTEAAIKEEEKLQNDLFLYRIGKKDL